MELEVLEVFFWIFVGVVVLVCFLLFVGLIRVREYEDDLYHKLYEQQGKISDHKERLDAHYQNIVTLSRQQDQLAWQVAKTVDNSLNERREKFAELRSQGMTILEAGKAIGVSDTTARRYEKYITAHQAWFVIVNVYFVSE